MCPHPLKNGTVGLDWEHFRCGQGAKPALDGLDASPGRAQCFFWLPDVDEWLKVAQGKKLGHIYGRNTNPTVAVFEEKLRILEGAEAAISFASGMAAISNTLFTLLSPGERVVSVNDTYGGTNKLFIEFLPRFHISVTLCDTTNHDD